MPETRRMLARDMVKLSKYVLPRFYGEVVLHEGREIGAVSVVWVDRKPVLCLNMTDELRKFPVFLVKLGHRFIEEAVRDYGELFTVEEPEEPTSQRFLDFLGFTDTGEFIEGRRLLKWQRSSH